MASFSLMCPLRRLGVSGRVQSRILNADQIPSCINRDKQCSISRIDWYLGNLVRIRPCIRSYTENGNRVISSKKKGSGTREVDRVKAVNAKLSAFLDSNLLSSTKRSGESSIPTVSNEVYNTNHNPVSHEGLTKQRALPRMIKGKRIRPRSAPDSQPRAGAADHFLDVPETRLRSHVRASEFQTEKHIAIEHGNEKRQSDATNGLERKDPVVPMGTVAVPDEQTSIRETIPDTPSQSQSEPHLQPNAPPRANTQTIIPVNRPTTEQEMMDIMVGGYTWLVTSQMRTKHGELVSARSNIDPLAVQASAEWKTRKEVRGFLERIKRTVRRYKDKQTAAEKCLRLLDRERARVPNGLGVITYTHIMGTLASAGDWPSAERLISEMQQKGFVPNQITHNSMLDAYATGGRDQQALALLRRLQRDNVPLNANSYNIVIKGLLRSTDPDRFRNAEFLKDEMYAGKGVLGPEDRRVLPNVYTYHAFIVGYAEAKDWEKALATYRSIPASIPMVRSTHSFVLDMLARRKEGQLMEEVFYAWQQKGAVGNGPVLNLRFACTRLPPLDVAHVTEVGRKAAMTKDKPTSDIGIYNILLKGYSIRGQVEVTRHIFSILQAYPFDSEFAPNANTYTECIRAAIIGGELETAMGYFELLQNQPQLVITSDTYKLMIKACREKPPELISMTNLMLNNLDPAVASQRVFYVLQTNKNVFPPQWEYSLGLFRHVHMGEPFAHLRQLFAKWECDGEFDIHYDLINQTLVDSARYEETVALYDDVKQGLKDQYRYRKTIEGRTTLPETDTSSHNSESVSKAWCIPSASANLIAHALVQSGRLHDVQELFKLGLDMDRKSKKGFSITDARPSHKTVAVLMKAFGDKGDWQTAEKIFHETLSYGSPVTTSLYNVLLEVYGDTGQIQSMLATVKEMQLQGNLTQSLTKISTEEPVSVMPDVDSVTAVFRGLAKHPFVLEPWAPEQPNHLKSLNGSTYLHLLNQEWVRMQRIGLEPSDATYTALFNAMHAFCELIQHEGLSAGDARAFERIHEDMLMQMVQALCAHDRASGHDIVNDQVLLSVFNNCKSDIALQRVRQAFASTV